MKISFQSVNKMISKILSNTKIMQMIFGSYELKFDLI